MNEDTGVPNVDWVSVMFHAAKEIGAENRRLQIENLRLKGEVQWGEKLIEPIRMVFAGYGDKVEPDIEKFIETLILDHAGFSRIREAYDAYVKQVRPGVTVLSLEQVVTQMIEGWMEV